jgi:hypothetical protein
MQDGQNLWKQYQDSWEAYSHKHAALGRLMDSVDPEQKQIEAAVIDLEQARMTHSATRDLLAQHLSAELPPSQALSAGADEQQVRTTARLFWEMAGRPEGTAECDWLRAERMIKSAAAVAA